MQQGIGDVILYVLVRKTLQRHVETFHKFLHDRPGVASCAA
jgi:hypothetical protein